MILIMLNLLSSVSWLNVQSILGNVPCSLQNTTCSLFICAFVLTVYRVFVSQLSSSFLFICPVVLSLNPLVNNYFSLLTSRGIHRSYPWRKPCASSPVDSSFRKELPLCRFWSVASRHTGVLLVLCTHESQLS